MGKHLRAASSPDLREETAMCQLSGAAGTCKRAWAAMEGQLATRAQSLGLTKGADEEVAALRNAEDTAAGAVLAAEQLLTLSCLGQSGKSSEWREEAAIEADPEGSDGSRMTSAECSEAADRESELLYLHLQPEQQIDESEYADWKQGAADKRRRLEGSWAQENAAAETIPAKAIYPCAAPFSKRPRTSALAPSPSPPPPSTPSPVSATLALFPRIKRARTRRPPSAVAAAVLALSCPGDSECSATSDHLSRSTLSECHSAEETLLPSPVSTVTLGAVAHADEAVAKYAVFCKAKTGTEGEWLWGTLCVDTDNTATVRCTCQDCCETQGPRGCPFSPVEFEAHAGRGCHKKWRSSLWVRLPPSPPMVPRATAPSRSAAT